MKNWITRWIVSALALLIITFIPNVGVSLERTHQTASGFTSLAIATIAMGLLNSIIRPIIMFFGGKLVNCLTFGIFGVLLNALMFWLVGTFVQGFRVSGPVAALVGSLAMGVISGLLNFLLQDRGEKSR